MVLNLKGIYYAVETFKYCSICNNQCTIDCITDEYIDIRCFSCNISIGGCLSLYVDEESFKPTANICDLYVSILNEDGEFMVSTFDVKITESLSLTEIKKRLENYLLLV